MRNKPEKISYEAAYKLYELEKENIEELCIKNNIELKKISCAGSLRRQSRLIGDIDIVIEVDSPDLFSKVVKESQSYYYKKNGDFYRGSIENTKIDLFVAGKYDFYSMLFFLTGSESWNLSLMSFLYKNKKLVFTPFSIRSFPDRSVLYFNSEDEIFNAMGIEKVVPRLRKIRNIKIRYEVYQ